MSEYIKISIMDVQKNNGEYSARVRVRNEIAETVEIYEVHTDKRGEGLWINGKQATGTCQFNASSKASFRAKMRRWFRANEGLDLPV